MRGHSHGWEAVPGQGSAPRALNRDAADVGDEG